MSGHPTTPLAFEAIAPDESRARLEAFAKRLRKRRTVRDFVPDPVPRDIIEQAILAAAPRHQAPTSSPGPSSPSPIPR